MAVCLPRRFAVISVGPLSPGLRNDFSEFCLCTDEVRTEAVCIEDEANGLADLPESLFRDPVDFTWVFVNESQVHGLTVLNVLSRSLKASPVILECYVDEPMLETGHECVGAWPLTWKRLRGKHGIVKSRYTDETYRSLEKWMVLSKRSEKVSKPVYSGEEARAKDPLYEKAKTIVLKEKRTSVSLIQRHLRIGYNHATRLLEAMEGDVLTAKDNDGVRRLLCDSSREGRAPFSP